MIIEARCCDCGKHIGCALLLGDTEFLKGTKYVRKISYKQFSVTLLCDECRDGRIDLEGEQE